MLRELAVHNLALIEDVRVELEPGFCCWTGETGAGKSLLLGAMGLLLGERGSPDLIRAGTAELRVTGVFEIGRVDLKAEIEAVLEETLDESTLIVTRRISRESGSRSHVNDRPVSITTLRKLGEILVDVHGQRDSHSLLEPAYQVRLLDAHGGLDSLRHEYDRCAERVRELRKRRAELTAARESRIRELSLIRFEREELAAAKLQIGEAERLAAERDRLANARSLQKLMTTLTDRLYDGDESVYETLARSVKDAHHWSKFDADAATAVRRFDALMADVRDLAETCRDLGDRYEADPERLEEIEERLGLFHRLETKYRRTIPDLIEYTGGLADRESQLQADESGLESIAAELTTAHAALVHAAEALRTARKKGAKKLISATAKHLSALGMPSAKLDCQWEELSLGAVHSTDSVPIGGADRLEFLLAANPGEPFRPLRKTASGGELSRAMLALKTVLAEHDPVGTLVFDEIDSNVGGRLGDVVGEKLAALGKTHQVICVTHLPQVACFARHQWVIRKETRGKKTTTSMRRLSDEAERLEELAGMLRGESQSATTRSAAAEMLAAARKAW